MYTSNSLQFEPGDAPSATMNLRGLASLYLNDGAMGSVIYCSTNGARRDEFVTYLEELSAAAGSLANRVKAWSPITTIGTAQVSK